MITKKDTRPIYTCRHCGYVWMGRPQNWEMGRTKPINCANPKCQKQDWDQPKKG